MDIKKTLDLLRSIEEGTKFHFAGEKRGQKPGDQVRGTEKATTKKSGKHPFAGRLVGAGESILRDLDKQIVEHDIERRLKESYSQFNEAENEFVLYINNKPVAKYDNIHTAREQRDHLIQKFPSTEIQLKQEFCDLIDINEEQDNPRIDLTPNYPNYERLVGEFVGMKGSRIQFKIVDAAVKPGQGETEKIVKAVATGRPILVDFSRVKNRAVMEEDDMFADRQSQKIGNAIIDAGQGVIEDAPFRWKGDQEMIDFTIQDGNDMIRIGKTYIEQGMEAGNEAFWDVDTAVRDGMYDAVMSVGIDMNDVLNEDEDLFASTKPQRISQALLNYVEELKQDISAQHPSWHDTDFGKMDQAKIDFVLFLADNFKNASKVPYTLNYIARVLNGDSHVAEYHKRHAIWDTDDYLKEKLGYSYAELFGEYENQLDEESDDDLFADNKNKKIALDVAKDMQYLSDEMINDPMGFRDTRGWVAEYDEDLMIEDIQEAGSAFANLATVFDTQGLMAGIQQLNHLFNHNDNQIVEWIADETMDALYNEYDIDVSKFLNENSVSESKFTDLELAIMEGGHELTRESRIISPDAKGYLYYKPGRNQTKAQLVSRLISNRDSTSLIDRLAQHFGVNSEDFEWKPESSNEYQISEYGMTTGGTVNPTAQQATPTDQATAAKQVATTQQNVNKLKAAGVNLPTGVGQVAKTALATANDPNANPMTGQGMDQTGKKVAGALGQEMEKLLATGNPNQVQQVATAIKQAKMGQK